VIYHTLVTRPFVLIAKFARFDETCRYLGLNNLAKFGSFYSGPIDDSTDHLVTLPKYLCPLHSDEILESFTYYANPFRLRLSDKIH
jgi:hypothetical protein